MSLVTLDLGLAEANGLACDIDDPDCVPSAVPSAVGGVEGEA